MECGAPDEPACSSRFRSSGAGEEEDRYRQLSPDESVPPLLVLLRAEVAIAVLEGRVDRTDAR